MALWLVRAGGSGEYESKFLDENKIFLTWEGLSHNLSKFSDKKSLYDFLLKQYPDDKPGTVKNWMSQIWPFAKEMAIEDWVVLPSKKKPAIHFAKIMGEYVNVPTN